MKEGWKKVHSRWTREGNFSGDNFVKIQPGIKTLQCSYNVASRAFHGYWQGNGQ